MRMNQNMKVITRRKKRGVHFSHLQAFVCFLSGVFTCIDFSSASGEVLEHSQGS